MFKWLFHIFIFATSGKYQNKEKPLKRQRKLGLASLMTFLYLPFLRKKVSKDANIRNPKINVCGDVSSETVGRHFSSFSYK